MIWWQCISWKCFFLGTWYRLACGPSKMRKWNDCTSSCSWIPSETINHFPRGRRKPSMRSAGEWGDGCTDCLWVAVLHCSCMMYNMIRVPRMVCTEYGFPWGTELMGVTTQWGIQLYLTKRLGNSACQTLIVCQWIPQDYETSLIERSFAADDVPLYCRCELLVMLVKGLSHSVFYFRDDVASLTHSY